MKKFVKFLFIISIVLLITSCVTRSPFTQEDPFFKTLTEDSAFVFTIATDKVDLGLEKELGIFASKIDRISFSLENDSYSDYPTRFIGYDIQGAIEGKFTKTLIKTALGISEQFQKTDGKEIAFYKDTASGMELAVPHGGIILFSNTDVNQNYVENYTEKKAGVIVDELITSKLINADAGMFISDPETMIDFGFDIPHSVVKQIEWMLITILGDKLSLDVQFSSDSLARSFSYLIRGGYIASLKRSNVDFDITELKQVFLQDGNKVSVENLQLTEEEKALFSPDKIRKFIGF